MSRYFAFIFGCFIAHSAWAQQVPHPVGGPATSVLNELTSWGNTFGNLLRHGAAAITDNKTAPLSADAAGLNVSSRSGTTAQQIYNQAVTGGTGLPFTDYSAVKGVNIVSPLSTINIAAGISGYTLNNTVPVGQKTSSASVNAIAVCAADGSKCWGYNAIVSDNPTLANTGVTAGTGKFLTNEFDLNITSPHSSGNGLAVGGTALPTNTTLDFQGFGVTKLWGAGGHGTGTALWANGFITEDACCATAMKIGAVASSGANKSSQPMSFGYLDAGGQQQALSLVALNGKLFAGGSASFGFATPNFPNPSTTAFIAGSMSSTGTNIPSQASVWGFLDAAGALQNYSIRVDTNEMVFQSSVPSTAAKFDFEGGLSVNGNVGVTCTAGTVNPATMTVVNGLVTHC